ncbi:amino acid/polyamine/organocation transporter, APC superfamily [Hymenobacter daecheongensis DSM 21074]|uniref:Amino acid/polyamine/organocation transporter, APC superfamily n=1 Tax=Hymenobacter daecheongensis DSM 21074 TaxID=1121955 RepID=A0A1M6IJ58_9BACT|nr:amino acid permease [Hymenobacter daecheongensis]SHJ34446.1 amino acid/polyamine/organocation transporter, APC superfamily [Hymenobacter daecheongensis DSM 21074]
MSSFNSLFRRKDIGAILQNPPADAELHAHGGLERNLTVRDLTALGIAAVIGAGIFSTIGNASHDGGPAVSLLFVFTAIACAFSALCYAQFAATIPISGSAYTYAYASFGELTAWIIGWALIMEYAVGNIVVAISWSDYFTGLMEGVGIHIPIWLTMGTQSAYKGYHEVLTLMQANQPLADVAPATLDAYKAWNTAPTLFGDFRLVCDLPAFLITVLITAVVYVGIKESKTASNLLVLLKLIVVAVVIAVGVFYVNPANWSPFAPNGVAGVLKGVSAVFFAYIGFDAISTTAEECKNPQRDLPRAMIYALIICTVLYVIITLVLTGMVSYKELGVGDPLAFVFQKVGLPQLAGVVAVSAVFAMASVLLVFQIGQPRIWMSMSRDGLLPPIFGRVHPRFHTPSFSTIVTGFFVGVPALFLNMDLVIDLTSIGTLFAFALVCGGILVLDPHGTSEARFKVPYINGKFLVPLLMLVGIGLLFAYNGEAVGEMGRTMTGAGGYEAFRHYIPMLVFFGFCVYLAIASFRRNLSLLPTLGLLTNLYLMTQLGFNNWLLFFAWLVIGLALYFNYGYKHSKLNVGATANSQPPVIR